jgi:hypothetical protein
MNTSTGIVAWASLATPRVFGKLVELTESTGTARAFACIYSISLCQVRLFGFLMDFGEVYILVQPTTHARITKVPSPARILIPAGPYPPPGLLVAHGLPSIATSRVSVIRPLTRRNSTVAGQAKLPMVCRRQILINASKLGRLTLA